MAGRHTISISEDAYKWIKARSDTTGLTIGDVVDSLVTSERITQTKKKVAATREDTALEPDEVDKAMGYERKPGEVTLRDGIEGLFAVSRGTKDMGRDRS